MIPFNLRSARKNLNTNQEKKYYARRNLSAVWEKLNQNGTEKEDQESINENRGPQLQYTSNWFAWNQIGIFKNCKSDVRFGINHREYDLWILNNFSNQLLWIRRIMSCCPSLVCKNPCKNERVEHATLLRVKSGTHFKFCNERNVVKW